MYEGNGGRWTKKKKKRKRNARRNSRYPVSCPIVRTVYTILVAIHMNNAPIPSLTFVCQDQQPLFSPSKYDEVKNAKGKGLKEKKEDINAIETSFNQTDTNTPSFDAFRPPNSLNRTLINQSTPLK